MVNAFMLPGMVDRPDPESLDHFVVLGLSPEASRRDIKRAYRRRAATFHPDMNPDDEEAPAILRRLNWAYAVLSDPDQRERYHELRGFAPPPPPDPPPTETPEEAAPGVPAAPPKADVRVGSSRRSRRPRGTQRKRAYARDVARESRRRGAMNAEDHAAMMGQITQAMAAAHEPPSRPWRRVAILTVVVGLALALLSWLRL